MWAWLVSAGRSRSQQDGKVVEPTYPDDGVVVLAQETQNVVRRREQHARRRHPEHLERGDLLRAKALLHKVEHLARGP